MLASVFDAFAFVRLWLTEAADLSCNLANGFFVDTFDRDGSRRRYIELDALRRLNNNRVRETKGQVQRVALFLSTIADTIDFELLGEAIRYTNNHVVDERTGQTMERSVVFIVGRTFYL